MLSGLSDFIRARAPGGLGWNKPLVVLAGVAVPGQSLDNSPLSPKSRLDPTLASANATLRTY